MFYDYSFITVDGKRQSLSDYLARKRNITHITETIQSLELGQRQEWQEEFLNKSNRLDDEPEICIMCGEEVGGVSRYCRSCRLAVIRRFNRVIESNFTTTEIDFLDDEIEGIGLRIKED